MPTFGSPLRSSAASILPSQSLSRPTQISTPPLVMSHAYSQPVATDLSASHQQSPGPLQAHFAMVHAVLEVSQGGPPEGVQAGVPWSTTQLWPHWPQSV